MPGTYKIPSMGIDKLTEKITVLAKVRVRT